MRVTVSALISLLALSACGSYADRVAGTCSRLGMGPGTFSYDDCVHQQVEIDQRNREMWSGVTVAGAALMAQPSYYRQPWSATCSNVGGFTNCRGY